MEPPRTGRHVFFAHKEHQVWLLGSPLDSPLCGSVYRAGCGPYLHPTEGQGSVTSLGPHTLNPGPRAVDGGSLSALSQCPAPLLPLLPTCSATSIPTSPYPSSLLCSPASSPGERTSVSPLLKIKLPPPHSHIGILEPQLSPSTTWS